MRTHTVTFMAGLLLAVTTNSFAQTQKFAVDELVQAVLPATIALRQHIHQYPELSNREFETAALVASHLQALGIKVTEGIAHTGVVGILEGAKPGPVIALRADMDALPVTEATDLSFRSRQTTTYNGLEVGVMHACGHDVHTAVLLGVASVLADLREQLGGTVIFVFQPAEEGPPAGEEGGAELMLQENVFAGLKPQSMYALHTYADMEIGKVGYSAPATAASSDTFKISINGKSSHGAFPEQSIDPVVIGAQVVMALQTIRSRNLSPHEPSVISITQFHGGIRNNIIPESVNLSGTVRVFSESVRKTVEARMQEIVENTARAAGGSSSFEYIRGNPPLQTDVTLASTSVPVLRSVLGAENVLAMEPVMASEDFAFFANEVPAFFFFLGTLEAGTTTGPNHSATFRAGDDSIAIGIKAFVALVMDRLGSQH